MWRFRGPKSRCLDPKVLRLRRVSHSSEVRTQNRGVWPQNVVVLRPQIPEWEPKTLRLYRVYQNWEVWTQNVAVLWPQIPEWEPKTPRLYRLSQSSEVWT